MIDAIITFSIRHRGAVIGAGLVLAVLGAWAAWETPVDAIPDLSENQVIVFTEWKGHGPREIEDQVTYPADSRPARAARRPGGAVVERRRLLDDQRDLRRPASTLAEARRRVAERLARVQGELPAGRAPSLAPDAAATGQIFWYTVEGGGLDLGRLRAIQDWYVRPQLGSVAGRGRRRRASAGSRSSTRSRPTPTGSRLFGVSLNDVVEAVARRRTPPRAATSSTRGTPSTWCGASAGWAPRPGRATIASTPRGPSATWRTWSCSTRRGRDDPARRGRPGRDRARLPPRRPGEGRQRGHRRRGPDGPAARTRSRSRAGIKAKIRELQAGLPPGVRIVPFYDRTPLIEGAIGTVTGTVVEAMISASLCVLVILLHVRTSLVIAVTLPLAALSSFLIMAVLRRLGHRGHPGQRHVAGGDRHLDRRAGRFVGRDGRERHAPAAASSSATSPVRGDVRDVVLPACLAVGRPIVFSVAIMLLSFLPVFALGGIEGKMFHPLAYTKTFALAGGRRAGDHAGARALHDLHPGPPAVRDGEPAGPERDRGLPPGPVVPAWTSPAVLAWVLGVTFLLGFAPLGSRPVFLGDRCSWRCVATALLRTTRRMAGAGAGQPARGRPGRRPDDDAAGARVHDAARRGDGHGHADHRPAGLGDANRSTT